MQLSREDRAVALFLSDRCPLRQALLKVLKRIEPAAESARKDIVFDVSDETLRKWRLGLATLGRMAFIDRLDGLLVRLRKSGAAAGASSAKAQSPGDVAERVRKLRDLLMDQDLNAYRIGEVLGYASNTAVQYELDAAFFRDRPIVSGLYYDLSNHREATVARERAAAVVGIYLMFLRRPDLDGRIAWWACPLRVRYLLRLDGDPDGDSAAGRGLPRATMAFIRAKMTVPDLRTGAPRPWDYDGGLLVNDLGLSVTMCTRTLSSRDIMQVTLGRLSKKAGDEAAIGQFLTREQDASSLPIAGLALLVRRHGGQLVRPGWAPEDPDFMLKEAQVLKPGSRESRKLDQMVAKLSERGAA